MHMFSREKNFFGGHGIVGAQVPIGTGSLSPKIKEIMGCLRHLSRRWRGQSGPGLGKLQHGGTVEAASCLYHRK